MDAKYERAVAKWLIAQYDKTTGEHGHHLEADRISNIRFTMDSMGVCETCYTEFAAIVFDYEYDHEFKSGKKKGQIEKRKYKDWSYTVDEIKAGEFVEEVVGYLDE